jgi:ribonuclease HI
MFLLTPGEVSLRVYGDASYLADVSVGTWAFQVPAFRIHAAGLEADTWIERLELMAIVRGIRAIADLDASNRAIQVYTDSDFVVSAFRYLSRREEPPGRRSFNRVRELLAQASAAMGRRQVTWFKIEGKIADHHDCHLAARRHLRKHVWDENQFSGYAALRRSERRLATRQRQYERLERQVEEARRELSIAEAETNAIRHNLRF